MNSDAPRERSGLGGSSLVFGIVAAVCALVPLIGDVLAIPPALGALVLGFLAVRRHEMGETTRVWPAIIGACLGALALFSVVMSFLVTSLFT